MQAGQPARLSSALLLTESLWMEWAGILGGAGIFSFPITKWGLAISNPGQIYPLTLSLEKAIQA